MMENSLNWGSVVTFCILRGHFPKVVAKSSLTVAIRYRNFLLDNDNIFLDICLSGCSEKRKRPFDKEQRPSSPRPVATPL